MDFTTDWFEVPGTYLIWSALMSFELVYYYGTNMWFLLEGKGADSKENWIDCRDLNDPIYRTIEPLEVSLERKLNE